MIDSTRKYDFPFSYSSNFTRFLCETIDGNSLAVVSPLHIFIIHFHHETIRRLLIGNTQQRQTYVSLDTTFPTCLAHNANTWVIN